MNYREIFKNIVLYGGISEGEYNNISDQLTKHNRYISLIFSSFAFVLIGIMAMLAVSSESFNSSLFVYITGIFASVLVFLLAYLGKYHDIFIDISVYVALMFYLMYGFVIGAFTRADEQTTTFIVMMVLLPLIFIVRPFVIYIFIIGYALAFYICIGYTKTDPIKSVDRVNVLIFACLAIASGTAVIMSKIKGYILEYKLHIMSETDQLTGLNNRNCYEWKLNKYKDLATKSLGCAYIDVNGLHELNNSHGHQAGDQMLKAIASEIRKLFGVHDTYRIGGDEFVIFVIDAGHNDIKKKLDKLKNNVEEQHYHIAVGYEFRNIDDINIVNMINTAEAYMYKAKSAYYSEMGITR